MILHKLVIIFIGTTLMLACNSSSNPSELLEDVSEQEQDIIESNDPEVIIPDYTPDSDLQYFSDNEISEEQVLVKGEVIKNLADDNEGSRHQKFLMRLASGQTLLISHNIDLADRIDALQEGDEVIVFGQYEWNDRGGVVHWTHHDPDGYHVDGYIEHENRVYQ